MQNCLRPTKPDAVYIHTQTHPVRYSIINMHFETSPGSSPSKSIPISISSRNMSSPTGSLYSNYSMESNSRSGSSCAYPSWPTGPSLEYRNPSSYISDEDLFGDDFEDDYSSCHFLKKAPAPPRVPPMAQAYPVLPPLYAQKKPSAPKTQQRRRSSGKQRRTSTPMTPISESPEQVE